MIINDRFLFLKHIQNIVAIIKNCSNIHYDIKWSDGSSFKVYVEKGARKYTPESGFPEFDIDEFLQRISDTADSLYEESLFRYTDDTPLKCTYSYCRDANEFVLFPYFKKC